MFSAWPRSLQQTFRRLVSRLEDHSTHHAFPFLPHMYRVKQWQRAVFVPSHGCGPAPVSHRTSHLPSKKLRTYENRYISQRAL